MKYHENLYCSFYLFQNVRKQYFNDELYTEYTSENFSVIGRKMSNTNERLDVGNVQILINTSNDVDNVENCFDVSAAIYNHDGNWLTQVYNCF